MKVRATAVWQGQERQIPEESLKGGPIERLTFHREPTRQDAYAFLPCFVKGAKWRVGENGHWRDPQDLWEVVNG